MANGGDMQGKTAGRKRWRMHKGGRSRAKLAVRAAGDEAMAAMQGYRWWLPMADGVEPAIRRETDQ